MFQILLIFAAIILVTAVGARTTDAPKMPTAKQKRRRELVELFERKWLPWLFLASMIILTIIIIVASFSSK